MKVLIGYKCAMDWAWLRIHRATSTLDASLIHLYPDVNYTKVVQQYFAKHDRREIAQLFGTDMVGRSLNSMKVALEIQDRVNEYTMFQGSLIRRHAQVFQVATNKFADVTASALGVLSFVVLIPVIVFVIVLFQQRYPELTIQILGEQFVGLANTFPKFQTQLWVLIILVNLYFFLSITRLKNRLRQKDTRPAHERVAAM
jgi:hypothetical protein